MNVDIYLPRLDVTFKKGPVPKERGKIPPLREYWLQFVKLLHKTYQKEGHTARILELPLWQISEKLVRSNSVDADIIYIPHKMKLNWFLDQRVRYYMQMVIPHIFSIDSNGWCASSTAWPIQPSDCDDDKIFSELSNRLLTNTSKFPQPQKKEVQLPDNFILFPCQIPHDETIQFHSDVSVEASLEALIKSIYCFPNLALVIKGHPVNPSSMQSLKNIFDESKIKDANLKKRQIYWIDDISIHQLLESCMAVFTVNSGVGLEAILHRKKVFTFGNADYSSISTKIIFGGSLGNAVQAINHNIKDFLLYFDEQQYASSCTKFIHSWYNCHADCENPSSFIKFLP